METSEPVLIKKYSNRRLYDTVQSKYITLEDLARIIQQGGDVKVVDAKGGQDLTRQVLTQVILEQQDRLEVIPVELLHSIIRFQGTFQQGALSAYLENIAQQVTEASKTLTEEMGQMFSSMPGFMGFGGFSSKGDKKPESNTEAATDGPPPKEEEAPEPGDAADAEESAQIEQLRKRMDALLERLGGMPKG